MFGKKKKTNTLIEELDSKFLEASGNKVESDMNALLNMNYIIGKQHLVVNNEKQQLEDFMENYEIEDRAVFNRIRPLRNTILSKIKTKIPEPRVMPYSQSDEDLDSAKATNAVLRDIWNRQKLNKKLFKVAKDIVDIGCSFIHVKWNYNKGAVTVSDVDAMLGDQSFMISPEEKDKLKSKLNGSNEMRSGDVDIEYVSLFEIFVADPHVQEIEEQPWVIRAKAYDIEEARSIFGINFKEGETVGAVTKQAYSSISESIYSKNLGNFNTSKNENVIVIKEYFEKPTSKYPEGRYILFGGGEIISKSNSMPYINDEYENRTYPFIKFGLDTPSLFYSHAYIEDMKSIQKRYNQIKQRKYEQTLKTIHGQLLVAEGSVPDDHEYTNEIGETITYRPGFAPPKMLNAVGQTTLDLDSEIRSLSNDFVEVSGVSTLSTNGVPSTSNVRSSNMAQMILDTDESKFSLIIDTLMIGVIDIAKQTVRLYKQFMKRGEKRFSRFTKNLTTTIEWNKDLLVEDIEIRDVNKLTTTDSRRKQDVNILLQSGVLKKEDGISPELRASLIEQMDLGIAINEMPIEGYADIKKARRENNLIVNTGAKIATMFIDDHKIHLGIHSNFMKSEEFRGMFIAKPDLYESMSEHIKEHQEKISLEQKRFQAQMAAEELQRKNNK